MLEAKMAATQKELVPGELEAGVAGRVRARNLLSLIHSSLDWKLELKLAREFHNT